MATFLDMDGRANAQLRLNSLFPCPELYDRDRSGPKSARDLVVGIRMARERVPVAGLTSKLSAILQKAPPPLLELENEVLIVDLPCDTPAVPLAVDFDPESVSD